MRNMATSLFKHGRIETTTAKAKELRPYAERLDYAGASVATCMRGVWPPRRSRIGRSWATLFDDIAPRFAERPGGYTRILKLGNRKGDAAEMSLIELVS